MRAGAVNALCEADCAMRGRHDPQCAEDDCGGCLRRQAADGLRLCDVHAERIAEDARSAPELYRDLCLVLVRGGGETERTSGSSTAAPVPDDAVMDARIAIRTTLIRLARVIVDERGIAAPSVLVGGRVFADTGTAALGDLVARHASWLAAHRDAARHSRELRAVVGGPVRALAYPHGSDRLYVGDCPVIVAEVDGREVACGTRLHQRADQPLITCTGCETQETIEQWQRWIVGGEAVGVCDAYAIAAHLAVTWMRPVDAGTIRQWAHRGHVQPLTRPDPTPAEPDRVAVVRDHRGRTQYRVAEVTAYAERAWGRPYATRP